MTDDARALRDRLQTYYPEISTWCGKPFPAHARADIGGEYYLCPECHLHRRVHTIAELAAAARLGAPETPARYALAEIVQQCAACGRNRSLSSWASACECGSRHAVISYVPPRPEAPTASPVSPGAPEPSALRALIAKWRADATADQRVSFCADELEAVLSAAVSGGTEP